MLQSAVIRVISRGPPSCPTVTIRHLSEEVHRALKARAAHHGCSTEAEMRDILEAAMRPAHRVELGTLMASIGREADLTEVDVDRFGQVRDRIPAEPPAFA